MKYDLILELSVSLSLCSQKAHDWVGDCACELKWSQVLKTMKWCGRSWHECGLCPDCGVWTVVWVWTVSECGGDGHRQTDADSVSVSQWHSWHCDRLNIDIVRVLLWREWDWHTVTEKAEATALIILIGLGPGYTSYPHITALLTYEPWLIVYLSLLTGRNNTQIVFCFCHDDSANFRPQEQ